jgi:glutamyl-tRNA synthetase
MEVRTRFAPSPTGYMHIGNLRTGLYAYCLARHFGGTFILRIEDTDRKRNNPKALQVIYDSLKLAGLEYDEGPDKDGGYGPYIQSQRKELGLYQRYAEELVERGQAYRCFDVKSERVEGAPQTARPRVREDPCRSLPPEEAQAKLEAGLPYVIRQRIPQGGVTTFLDVVYGSITVKNETLDDQVLLKSDGYPTYNFANVVDDHLMGITHVMRGVEYLSSTPKYNLLYQGFGWEIPEYIHLPHIVKEGGKKLSKRSGDASFQDLITKGYLPEAIVNYIALLGWNPGSEQEFFTLPDLVQEFEVKRVNKSKATFYLPKLDWLNGEHLRKLAPERFHALALKWYPERVLKHCNTLLLSQVIQSRVAVLSAIPEMVGFFSGLGDFDLGLFDFEKNKSTKASSRQVLKEVGERLSGLPEWSGERIKAEMLEYGTQAGMKVGTVMWPVRVALSGQQFTPGGAIEIAEILGKDETLARMSHALGRLERQTLEA